MPQLANETSYDKSLSQKALHISIKKMDTRTYYLIK